MFALLYILLGVSILAPIYTYALYPFVLKLFSKKSFRTFNGFSPSISLVIYNNDRLRLCDKIKNIKQLCYPHLDEILVVHSKLEISRNVHKVLSEIIIFTDTESLFEPSSIINLLQPLYDKRVGCVCGILRKMPDKNGAHIEGANWIYENKIKLLESNIGALSGANTAIFAVRKNLLPVHFSKLINLDFEISTSVLQSGYYVLFEPKAVAYENSIWEEKELFIKHVQDGLSGYASILHFWRLLLPRKGCFVFWSHRVMKWLVPFNLVTILIICAYLSQYSVIYIVLTILQIFVYCYISLYYRFYVSKERHNKGLIWKVSGLLCYFFTLNLAWLLGFLKAIKKK